MKPNRLALMIAVFGVCPGLAFAQKREYVELQRDVAALQDQVRSLQRSLDESVGKMTALLQQAIDSINKVNTSVAVLDNAMREREKNLAAPVTGVGAKVDQMASEFQYLRTAIEDMNSRMGKLERQLVDLGNTIKVITSPPAPPPGGGAAGAPGGAPPIPAETLYANAMRDQAAGNYDMALQGFNDYLKYYGNTSTAPNAQYYIGEIYYNRKDYDNALKAFDAVLEVYPENNKTLDAMFMKGRALVQMGQRKEGAEEFRAVIARRPDSELAAKARQQLKNLGLPLSSPSKRPARRK